MFISGTIVIATYIWLIVKIWKNGKNDGK